MLLIQPSSRLAEGSLRGFLRDGPEARREFYVCQGSPGVGEKLCSGRGSLTLPCPQSKLSDDTIAE